MEENNLMDPTQHGSLMGWSTVTQILEQHDQALCLLDDGGVADIFSQISLRPLIG